MNQLRAFWLLLLGSSVTVSCAGRLQYTVSPQELAQLSGDERQSFAEPEQEREQADFLVAERRVELRLAEWEVQIAKHVVDRVEAEMAIRQIRYDGVQDSNDADLLVPAREKKAIAERALRQALAYQQAWEARIEYLSAVVEEAKAQLYVADGRLERAKYLAVAMSQAKPETEVSLAKASFDEAIAQREATLARERALVAAAKEKFEVSQRSLEERGGPPEGDGLSLFPHAEEATPASQQASGEEVPNAPTAEEASPGDSKGDSNPE